jgi:hypothetical protein
MEQATRTGMNGATVTLEIPPPPVVEALLEAATPPKAAPPTGGVLGTLTGWDEAGRPLVAYSEGEAIPALSTVPLTVEQIGHEVALLFLNHDAAQPLIVGVIQPPGPLAPVVAGAKVEASLDGERLEFTAGREIVFRCGAASITLTKAGKVLIHGAYLLSRSTGVNRIKGGSVQIN